MNRLALISTLTFLSAAALALWRHRRHRNALPYPPGPPPRWLIGNLTDMPPSFAWLRFSEWGAKYGEITYANILGQSTIILNSLEACKELLEKRGANAAGRPFSVMLELMGVTKSLTQHQDDVWWRYQRRLTFSAFGPQAVKHYHPIHELNVAKFLQRMLDPSADCAKELRFAIGKIMFEITYRLPIEQHFDEFTRMSDLVADAFLGATIPGRYLVESIPILRYLPEWFPGAAFRRFAAHIAQTAVGMTALYYDAVKEDVAKGTAAPSFVANCLQAQASGEVKSPLASKDQDEDALAWAASGMYRAGTTTTEQTIYKFLTAMQMYPEIQRKAQEEVARIVGRDRMPTIEDRHAMPYVNALILECLRWHAGIATGIPHRTAKDDVYKGYFIPKNTTILFNSWNLSLHAEDGSPLDRPYEFIPERFLADSPKSSRPINPEEYAFGFGRRICPGRHIANDILFLMISGLLTTVWVSNKVDKNGNEVPLPVQWSGAGAISYPLPLHPRFEPRSSTAVDMINRAAHGDPARTNGV
ncbi:cytochrome P450 [Auricularia subglabra TFB-10046 SS5]|nr:cytochrome P450 [Auricularia subglabra TFB-10046 SS5]